MHELARREAARAQSQAASAGQRNKNGDPQKCKYHVNCHGVHPYGLYEDAPYHHQNSRGRKNPAPIDGQTALNYSIFLSKNDKGKERRIGLSCGQMVVLDQTAPMLFHGHVRDWDDLDNNMRSKLHDNGWAQYKSGKISWPSWAK